VQEAFRLTGTSHIIVISGFNITIIAGLFTLLFSRLQGERKGVIVAAIGIIFHTLLVGANAAVVRAAFLSMLTLLGHQLGRAVQCAGTAAIPVEGGGQDSAPADPRLSGL
jgi:competence protein ComEC